LANKLLHAVYINKKAHRHNDPIELLSVAPKEQNGMALKCESPFCSEWREEQQHHTSYSEN
jgi:hypothetical protein